MDGREAVQHVDGLFGGPRRAAAAMGHGESTWHEYKGGRRPVPRYVFLHCLRVRAAIDRGFEWRASDEDVLTKIARALAADGRVVHLEVIGEDVGGPWGWRIRDPESGETVAAGEPAAKQFDAEVVVHATAVRLGMIPL